MRNDWINNQIEKTVIILAYFATMVILVCIIILAPVASVLNRIKRVLVTVGLQSEKRKLLIELDKCRRSNFSKIIWAFSEDSDYSQAQMNSSFLGYQVLFRQRRARYERELEIKNLVDNCHKAGIASWRIWLIKPVAEELF